MVMDMMMESPEDTTFAFTDGSCQPNPGPCGAGAVLYPPHCDPVPLKKPVSAGIYTLGGTSGSADSPRIFSTTPGHKFLQTPENIQR